jgi:tryptophan 6-halogenase
MNGVKSLNKKYTADLFVDCTGFKSLLLGGALKEPFISYSDMLPNNKAWATRVPYKDKENN